MCHLANKTAGMALIYFYGGDEEAANSTWLTPSKASLTKRRAAPRRQGMRGECREGGREGNWRWRGYSLGGLSSLAQHSHMENPQSKPELNGEALEINTLLPSTPFLLRSH